METAPHPKALEWACMRPREALADILSTLAGREPGEDSRAAAAEEAPGALWRWGWASSEEEALRFIAELEQSSSGSLSPIEMMAGGIAYLACLASGGSCPFDIRVVPEEDFCAADGAPRLVHPAYSQLRSGWRFPSATAGAMASLAFGSICPGFDSGLREGVHDGLERLTENLDRLRLSCDRGDPGDWAKLARLAGDAAMAEQLRGELPPGASARARSAPL